MGALKTYGNANKINCTLAEIQTPSLYFLVANFWICSLKLNLLPLPPSSPPCSFFFLIFKFCAPNFLVLWVHTPSASYIVDHGLKSKVEVGIKWYHRSQLEINNQSHFPQLSCDTMWHEGKILLVMARITTEQGCALCQGLLLLFSCHSDCHLSAGKPHHALDRTAL